MDDRSRGRGGALWTTENLQVTGVEVEEEQKSTSGVSWPWLVTHPASPIEDPLFTFNASFSFVISVLSVVAKVAVYILVEGETGLPPLPLIKTSWSENPTPCLQQP